jgi:GTP-binding protein
MHVKAEFLVSSAHVGQCPNSDLPEYAFIGRSNVGKSSLINMLAGNSSLAKTSGTPGKTRLINHFNMHHGEHHWLLADLPGYGYAKVSKKDRAAFEIMIRNYLTKRENLVAAFVLIDGRHKPQQIDMEFMAWLGKNEIPFAIVFTKADKLSSAERAAHLKSYTQEMLKTWEFLPEYMHTSAETGFGRDALLQYINEVNASLTR